MKKLISIILPAAALLAMTAGCHRKEKAAMPTPRIEVAVPTIDSVVLHRTFPGTMSAARSADVVARVSGTLLKKCYNDGDYVKAGQTLFVIEGTTYSNALQDARSQLATAKSQHEYYSHQYEAMKKAYAEDAVAEINVLETKSNLEQAAAAIDRARITINNAQVNMGYCTVTAPISGRVSAPNVLVGNYVGGDGSTVLCTIVDNSELKVTFDIGSAQFLALVPKGLTGGGPLYSQVPLSFREKIAQTYTTDLFYAAPSVDTSTGAVTLEGRVDNPEGILRDGMYVTVQLPYGVDPHAILVSNSAIGTDQLGKYLFVVNDSNRVVYTPIEVGEVFQDTLRVVTKGIKPDSRYVTKALLTVRNGMTVDPVMTPAKPRAK